MVTYKQKYHWFEEGWGPIQITFMMSDNYLGLFATPENSVNMGIFNLDTIAKDVATKAGGYAEHQHTFEVNEAQVQTIADQAALTFVKTARAPANVIYCGVFINTSDTPNIADKDFIGVIQPEEDADDLMWHGEHYNMAPAPLRKWRMKARPFSSAILEKFTVEELVNGTTDGPSEGVKYINPIDSTWEGANVFDGQGYFFRDNTGTTGDYYLMASDLVPLNKVLRKLADQFQTGLLSKFGVDLNVTFSASELEGEYHPTRWCPWVHFPYEYKDSGGATVRTVKTETSKSNWWLQQKFKDDTVGCKTGFAIYGNDKQSLIIDPDNSSAAELSQIYISYRMIKSIFLPPLAPFEAEPDAKGAESLMWTKKYKSFTELIYALGLSLGLTVVIEPTGADSLNIAFYSRKNFVKPKIYLKTAEKAKLKGSATPIDATGKIETFVGKANCYAEEGPDLYKKTLQIVVTSGTLEDLGFGHKTYKWVATGRTKSGKLSEIKQGKEMALTISPTIVYMDCYGNGPFDDLYNTEPYKGGTIHGNGTMAVNHYFAEMKSGSLVKTKMDHDKECGIHTGMWMYVQPYADHKDAYGTAYPEPMFYYTPVGAMTIERAVPPKNPGEAGSLVTTYYKLSDYLNELYNIDTEHFNVDYDLDVPYYYGFSENSDGSSPDWKCIGIGSEIELDGINYTVIGITRKLNRSMLTLKLTGVAKFNFETATLSGNITPQGDGQVSMFVLNQNIICCKAKGTIAQYSYVVKNTDGTVSEKNQTVESYGNNVGICLENVTDGQDCYIQTAGEIINDDWNLEQNKPMVIYTPISYGYNITQTELQGKDGTNVLNAKVAIATAPNAIKINRVVDERIYA